MAPHIFYVQNVIVAVIVNNVLKQQGLRAQLKSTVMYFLHHVISRKTPLEVSNDQITFTNTYQKHHNQKTIYAAPRSRQDMVFEI